MQEVLKVDRCRCTVACLPKRGFTSRNRVEYAIVNLSQLTAFDAGNGDRSGVVAGPWNREERDAVC